MNNYAIIKDGVVDNIIVAKSDFATTIGAIPANGASIGDLWDGNTFTKPTIIPPPFVPKSVTMRQARLALLQAGLLTTVANAISTADQATQIEWEYANDVLRASGLIPTMATALGMTETQIDDLFILAATL